MVTAASLADATTALDNMCCSRFDLVDVTYRPLSCDIACPSECAYPKETWNLNLQAHSLQTVCFDLAQYYLHVR